MGRSTPRGTRGPGHGRLLAAPTALAAVLVTVGGAAWFAASLDRPRGPLILLWLPGLVVLGIDVYADWRASRVPALPRATRRFWRQLGTGTAFILVGTVSTSWDAVNSPAGLRDFSAATLAWYAAGIVMYVVALLRLPLGAATPGERLRLGLDIGTVVLAAGVFVWHYQTRPLLERHAGTWAELTAQGTVAAMSLLIVFAAAKVIFSGGAFVDRRSLQLLGLSVVLAGLGELPQVYLQDRPYLLCAQVVIPVSGVVSILAARSQQLAGAAATGAAAVGGGAPPGPALVRQRPYTVLPYLAIAAVDGLLLASIRGTREDGTVVAAAAVLLTALVVVRQLTVLTENRRLLARLDHHATHDALTGLPNRALFRRRLGEILDSPGRRRDVCVALIDLDDFKLVNDSLGHAAGDALLSAVAPRLRSALRPRDTVARLGGDEFVVLLDDVDLAEAERVVGRLAEALAAPVATGVHDVVVRASIGIAAGRTGDDGALLMRRADVAMYEAKKTGGSVVAFHGGLAGAVDVAGLTADLREAVAGGQLFLLYQPIVSLDGARLLGVEALVRWRHPVRGVLGPGDFIAVAERTGLVVPLGRWVLRQACAQLAAWSAGHGDVPGVLHVNVSQVQLRDPAFVGEVAAVLAETAVAPGRLVLEITETAVASLGGFLAAVVALRGLGIRIAFDDFGTAQSTLSLLDACPVDVIKLDGSFVRRPPAAGRTMAEAVVRLGDALGLSVVAEGVETRQQAEYLRGLGYEAGQGFLFARPMSVGDIDDLLRRRQRAEQAA